MAIYHEDHLVLVLRCKAILNHKTGFTLIEAIWDWLAAEFENLQEKALCLLRNVTSTAVCVRLITRFGASSSEQDRATISRSINSLWDRKYAFTSKNLVNKSNQSFRKDRNSSPSMALGVQSGFQWQQTWKSRDAHHAVIWRKISQLTW